MRISELLTGRTLAEALEDNNMSTPQSPSPMSMAPPTPPAGGGQPGGMPAAGPNLSGLSNPPTGGSQPNMQMANSAPAQMIPNIFGQQATQMMNKTTDRVEGGSTPQLNTGSFFQSTVGKPPLPLE